MATAAHVIAQSSLPSIQLQTSAAMATTLTFGDPAEKFSDQGVMDIPVKLYKATATARPLSQKKLSKIAQESAAAQSQAARVKQEFSQYQPSSTPHIPRHKTAEEQIESGETGLTYGVQMQKKYFIKDDLEKVEGGIEGAEPLPEGAEVTFDKAYKLGATLVAINEDLESQMDTKAGMEIIQFTNGNLYRRHYHMGETSFLFASDGNYKAQVQFSSLVQAMSRQKKYAIVRLVRRNGAEPKVSVCT
jgi:ATP-dependent DNA helicase 2 subunit 2